MTLTKRHNKLAEMIKRQIKEVSVHKDSCMKILHPLLSQMSCLQTLATRKIYVCFLHVLSVISDPL